MLPAILQPEVDQLAEQIAVLMSSVSSPDAVLGYLVLAAIMRHAEINNLAEDTEENWGNNDDGE